MEPLSPRRSHVLLVDDDLDTLETMSEVLRCEGIEAVARARTVAEAEQVLSQGFVPSTIVLDLTLQAERGETLIARLQEDPALRTVAVVALSGDDRALAEIRECVARTLLKPVDPAELVRALAEFDGACDANGRAAGAAAVGARVTRPTVPSPRVR